jgi:hypothetical protein
MNKARQASKEISAKKVAANRQNAQKSTGPRDTAGTRFNAMKHGLLSEGLTELDRPEEFLRFLDELTRDVHPSGVMERLCVEQIAHSTCRLARAKLLEREEFTAQLHPPKTVHHEGSLTRFDPESFGWTETVDPGRPARISHDVLDRINRTVLRYESSIENKLMRWWNLLERLQARRGGEKIPAPAALDLNVHHDTAGLASFGNSPHE